ncbi:MAG: hypothetical protein IJ548_01395, partial [Paludibacteraceae bacterium]|nr:hypothetical protein [Paludibacteraceae bacterium]
YNIVYNIKYNIRFLPHFSIFQMTRCRAAALPRRCAAALQFIGLLQRSQSLPQTLPEFVLNAVSVCGG